MMRFEEFLNFRNIITWFVTNAMPIKFAKQIGLYAYSCQYILYYSKGTDTYLDYEYLKSLNNGKQHRDIFIEPSRKHNTNLKHPTRKPDELIIKLIKAHSQKNAVVLDFFLGSGTTALCAKQLNRHFIGVENNEEYFNEALWRLENNE